MSPLPARDAGDETPILDLQVALPAWRRPAAEPGPFSILALWLGAAVAAWLALRAAPVRHWFEVLVVRWLPGPWTPARLVWVVLSLVGVGFAAVVVHELGHVVAGLAAGYRFRALRIGPLLLLWPLRVERYRGPGSFTGGFAQMTPGKEGDARLRATALVLGGPLASLLAGAIVLAVWPSGPARFALVVFAVASIVGGLADLLPFRTSVGGSDGVQLRALLGDRPRGERLVALLQLGAELNEGVPPELLSSDAIARAVGVADETAETVNAHAIAYSAAFNQHRDDEAARLLETCLRFSAYARPAVREALMSDAAVFQGRRRRRPDLAEKWLAAMPETIQPPWLRTRAEAAMLEARGDIGGALAKLDAIAAAIAAVPEETRRLILQRSLSRWRSELTATSPALSSTT